MLFQFDLAFPVMTLNSELADCLAMTFTMLRFKTSHFLEHVVYFQGYIFTFPSNVLALCTYKSSNLDMYAIYVC